MFRRVGQQFVKKSTEKYLGTTPPVRAKVRCDEETTSLYSTGGLGKFQGGLKEEKYFCSQNGQLMEKLRQQGETLACEKHFGNWSEYQKRITSSEDKTAQRESAHLNKHKNCHEEAFFLNEQIDNVKILQSRKLDVFNYIDGR